MFGRWSFRAHLIDVALYGASSLDQRGVVLVPEIDPASMDEITLTLDHPRTTTVGVSGALPVDAFVFKLEAAAQPYRSFNILDPMTAEVSVESITAVSAMAGINYWKAPWRVTVEAGKTQLLDATIGGTSANTPGGPIVVTSTDTVVASRVQYEPELGKLRFTVSGAASGDASGPAWLVRAEAGWEVVEGLTAGLGVATYHATDELSFVTGLDKVDRLFARVRWDFGWN